MEAKFLANALKLNTSLSTLNLRNNQLNETGILILAENMKFLTSLDLGKSKIGDEGATFLTPILVSSFTLRFLYLNDNMIGDTGAIALSKALKTNSFLVYLRLDNNNIGNIGATALAKTYFINLFGFIK